MFSHYKLGELRVKLLQFESALAQFGAGIALLDAMIARGLNADQSTREKAILVARLQFCLATLATGDWDRILKIDAGVLPRLLSLRATEMARQGKLADVAQAGAKLRELKPSTNVNLYNAACAFGLCAGLVVRASAKPEEAEARRYRDLAIACLRGAIAAGYKNFDHMRRDDDLKPLHGVPEFENLFPKGTR